MLPLQVIDLKKSYKVGFIPKVHSVLKGVSFSVQPGKITGFLGGNGAGKTTTLRCILGLAFPDGGEFRYFGKAGISLEAKRRIGFLPERPYFYEHLSGVEFLTFYAKLSGDVPKAILNERIEKLLKRVDLYHAKDKRLREYSKGMLQKIGIAQALIHNPELVILDEPMSGLDPDGRYYLSEIIKECASEGRAVFFSSHLLPDAEKLCENLVILKSGKVIYEGGTEAFISQMGEASVISYFLQGEKRSQRVESNLALQQALQELIEAKATIVDVKQDRNLEEAFIRVGLRGKE